MDNRENIERIKEKIDIVTYIGKYVKLKQAGRNFSGLCPFHQEKTPSFTVSPSLGIYKCFGCGKAGDIFNFVEEIEKLDFPETLEKLAKETGVILSKAIRVDNPLEDINELACRYFEKNLYKPENKTALEYLHNRKLDDTTIKKFRIGYSSGNGMLYTSFKRFKKFTDKQLEDSGIFVIKENRLKEKFYKRIVFPIFSTSNRVIAFSGRVLPGNDLGPKYLNSPETAIFQKRNNLYGLNFAKTHIRREDLCIVLEGQTDVISTHKAGYENAVAPLGTGLTKEQLETITRYTFNILFLFDSDTAGQTALERAFLLASSLSINSFAANTGEFKDIDEMIQKKPEDAREMITNKADAFSYLVANKAQNLDLSNLSSFATLNKYVRTLLEHVKDESLLSFYLSKAEKITGVNFGGINTQIRNDVAHGTLKSPSLTLEEMYLKSLLANIVTAEYKEHDPSYITNPNIQEIVEEIVIKGVRDIRKLSNQEVIERIEMTTQDVSDLDDIYKRIEKEHFSSELKQLRIKLAAAEEKRDTKGIDRILETITQITGKLKKYK